MFYPLTMINNRFDFTPLRFRALPTKNLFVMLLLLFSAGSPLAMFGLLVTKGLPSFAAVQTWQAFLWVYQVTWMPALLAGVLMASLTVVLTARSPYFHQPFDFGRSFSLGAICGALFEAFATWLFRWITHHPFSQFWIAGSTIAGCLAGGISVSFLLWWYSRAQKV